VRALGAIGWSVTAFDWRVAVKGPAWGASSGEIARNAASLPARDGPGGPCVSANVGRICFV